MHVEDKRLFSLEKEQSEEGLPPGRKFLMGRYALLLATLGFLSTALAVPLSTNFAIFIGGLATLFGIYCGGNISNKWITKPTLKSTPNIDNQIDQGPGPIRG